MQTASLAPVRSGTPAPDAHGRASGGWVASAGWREWAGHAARSRWQSLADGASEPNPFLEPWYALPALEAFAPDVQIVSVERGGALIGLLPLARPRRYAGRPIPHLGGWLHANAFLGAPLVTKGREAAFWAALLDWADDHAGAALFLHLSHLPLDTPLVEALFAACASEGRRAVLVHREERALLQSALSPEAYLEAALPGKKRKELRRQHARLAEQGTLAFVREEGLDGLAEWTDAFLALEASGWKGRAGSALASSPQTAALFREGMAGAAQAGVLERLALTLDGKPIAMLANFLRAPGAFSYKTAFDEAYARFSPGVLLQRENLALLDRPDITWCDSCAAPDHPMIDSLWRERRAIGRVSIAIGGAPRRALFAALVKAELGRNPTGVKA